MTRKNTKCSGLTGSKRLNFSTTPQFLLFHTQKPNQLPKHSKVRCKEEEEAIQIICKTQNRDLPPGGPFSQILSQFISK